MLDKTVTCELSPHEGKHHGAVEYIDSEAKMIWGVWRDGGTMLLQALPDCGEGNGLPAGEDDACVLFTAHRGLHSWDMYDPEVVAARREWERQRRASMRTNIKAVPIHGEAEVSR
ncbi:hypothetical protein ACFY0N_31060 [Streptomyces vinaceus]|uniref:hypothetical protein n=1 Tax=Streptomyces vinaceus TaxID=1960 RepID=UPI0036B56B59